MFRITSLKTWNVVVVSVNWWSRYSKVCSKPRMLNYPCVCLEIRVFNILTWWLVIPQSLSIITTPFPLTPVKSALNKDRDDIRPQASNRYRSGSSMLKLSPAQNLTKLTLFEIKASQSYIHPSFAIVRCLATPNASLHHLTPIGIGDKHFLTRLVLLFNVQWEIFNKKVPQALV